MRIFWPTLYKIWLTQFGEKYDLVNFKFMHVLRTNIVRQNVIAIYDFLGIFLMKEGLYTILLWLNMRKSGMNLNYICGIYIHIFQLYPDGVDDGRDSVFVRLIYMKY